MKVQHLRTPAVIGVALILIIQSAQANEYWDSQRKGANWFNSEPDKQWLIDASKAGIRLVRLAPDKWKGAGRDFLIGNADRFDCIPATDLRLLRMTLDWADSIGLKILLVPLSLPGARWKQNNGGTLDLRLWRDSVFQNAAVHFWKELSLALKGHPALVGYDVLNEPVPEKIASASEPTESPENWHRGAIRTPADLNRFYDRIVGAIRKIDSGIQIIVESGNWGDPKTLKYLRPIRDPNVMYSFHMYEPWDYVNIQANGGKRAYRSNLDSVSDSLSVTKSDLLNLLTPVVAWQEENRVPSNRIFVGEFGCHRRNPGVEAYLADLMAIFNEHGWHWAFYSYREDLWDGMDYEMGDRPAGAAYWEAVERGERPSPRRYDNPIWNAISKEFHP